jgi:indolepyruvate ferredoxin oxidoreductase
MGLIKKADKLHKILNGNELLIEGGLEAGFNLYTGYPGSPLGDFFNILYQRKKELQGQGIKVVIANSEANAAAMASGAKMAGQNVLVGMKSMGLHVASDALSVGNFANPGPVDETGEMGGVVIAVGDDPWSISTSTPADSRYLFKHLHIPFLEPATPQELKDWMKLALQASRESSVYFGVLLTTFMAEGGGRVETFEKAKVEESPVELDSTKFDLSQHVMVPPNSLGADKRMIESRFPKVYKAMEKLNLDKITGQDYEIGFISSGATAEVLKQVLEETNLIEHFPLYKSATSFPLNEKQMLPFIKDKNMLIVVEEKRGFLEDEVRSLMQKNGLAIEVYGKKFENEPGFPAYGGLNFEIIQERVDKILKKIQWGKENATCDIGKPNWKLDLNLPKRLPTFCPGCPHRETLSLLKEIRANLKEDEVDLISHGDVGCYSLSFLEPFKEMHDLSAMGQGGSLGAGTDIFTKNPSVVLMGDSTFFHSGMTGISNSVQMGHNITYVLLDNDNTAMTGHQVTPRTGINVEGSARPRQNMLEIAKSMKVDEAIEVNPSDRYFYKNLLMDFIKKPGVKVIVSNKECALTYFGRKKKEDRKKFSNGEVQKTKSFYQINTFACEDCRACVEMTGCPGLSQGFDVYGTKVNIDPQICVSDSYCTKIKACPSFELVEVADYHPTKYQKTLEPIDESSLPEPTPAKTLEHIAAGDTFRAVVIGVGGSGVTTISRVLAQAAEQMDGRSDLDFKFVDQKGLAQRNGSVTGHLSIFSKLKSHSQTTPLGSADLVMSPDLLEGARAVNYLKKSGLLVVDADYQIPLSILLDRGIEADPITQVDIQERLKSVMNEQLIMADMKNKSFNLFQKSVYSSAMLLGIVFQAGKLPFNLSNMKTAFEQAIPKGEFENNWYAFQLGRKIYLEKEYNQFPQEQSEFITKEDIKISLLEAKYPWQTKKGFLKKFEADLSKLQKSFLNLSEHELRLYLHDLYVYDHGKNVEKFHTEAIALKGLFPNEKEFKLAFRVLVKTYWVKDEVFVAHQLAGHLKRKYDERQYKNLGTKYKVKHINRPHFDIGNFKIEFDIHTRDWMLKIMKHLRILRPLMPNWHSKERRIAGLIRTDLLKKVQNSPDKYKRLKELESIKGYREIRYVKAAEVLDEFVYEK